METTIRTNTNDELNVLRVKLDVIEKELQLAVVRAEKAEAELERSQVSRAPVRGTCCACSSRAFINSDAEAAEAAVPSRPPPPPPPPPMPDFALFPTNSLTNGVSLSDGIAAFSLNNARQGDSSSVSDQQVKRATGW